MTGAVLRPQKTGREDHAIALLTERREDAERLAEFGGRLVAVCGYYELQRGCWTGDLTCAPTSKPVWLKRATSVREIEPTKP